MFFDFLIIGTSDFFSISMIRMATEFKKKGFSVGIISGLNIWSDLLISLKREDIPHIDIENVVERYSSDFIIDEKVHKAYEDRYNLVSMRDFVFPEKVHYSIREDDKLIVKAARYFNAIELFLSTTKVKCFIHMQGSEIISRAFYTVGQRMGIPSIFMGESLFPNKMFIYSDEMNSPDNFKMLSYQSMTPQEREYIDNYIMSFVENKGTYKYPVGEDMIMFNKIWMLRSMRAKYLIRKVRLYLYNRVVDFKNRLIKFLLSPYSDIKTNERYLYFPMHAWSDSQITLRAPQFYRQVSLVELIARSLPQGYVLYVKEHPGEPLNIAASHMWSLKRIKNVRLLHPKINSHSIIQNSCAVIVINSTVGFEALHYFKPVISLGNNYLRGHGITIDVDNLYDLRLAIKKALNTTVDGERVKAFIFSLMKATYDGTIFGEKCISYSTIVESFIKKAQELGVNFR